MVRWLLGLNHDEQQFAAPVVKLFDCTLANDGDLNGEDNIRLNGYLSCAYSALTL